MDFSYNRDYGKGVRKMTLSLRSAELEKLPARFVHDLREAEKADEPRAILAAWLAICPKGAEQLTLLGGDDEDED